MDDNLDVLILAVVIAGMLVVFMLGVFHVLSW
jgi:hypothetical protein